MGRLKYPLRRTPFSALHFILQNYFHPFFSEYFLNIMYEKRRKKDWPFGIPIFYFFPPILNY